MPKGIALFCCRGGCVSHPPSFPVSDWERTSMRNSVSRRGALRKTQATELPESIAFPIGDWERGKTPAASATRLAASPTRLAASSTGLVASSTGLAASSTGLAASPTGLAASPTGLAASSTGLVASSTGLVAHFTETAMVGTPAVRCARINGDLRDLGAREGCFLSRAPKDKVRFGPALAGPKPASLRLALP